VPVNNSSSASLLRASLGLDALNFFLADVAGGLGPYLAVYLLTVRQWSEAEIGIVMSVAGVAGIVSQTPAGALVDTLRAKRTLIAAAAFAVTVLALALSFLDGFWSVATVQTAIGVCGAVFGPAIGAISLGIVGHQRFARRNGRNEAFNHAGNAFAAAVAGIAAYEFGPIAVFFLLAVMALASLASVLAIPSGAIDHDIARGLPDGQKLDHEQPSGFAILLSCRPLLIFTACVVLFHLANAAMLPLVGQKIAMENKNLGTSAMSACILAAQIVMVPMAILVGRTADGWGRKPLFLAGFLILPIRGALYTLSDDPAWLVGVQLLDGVGAGLFGALFPLIVADLTWGTGRFNVTRGAVQTAQGIGAALSTTIAGLIIATAGYSAAFLVLAAIAALGLMLFSFAMPETRNIDEKLRVPVQSSLKRAAE
jgi:predicted MFS family arabinose efflux permease